MQGGRTSGPGSRGVEVSQPGCPGEPRGAARRWGSEYQGGESTFDGLKAANHTQRGAGGAV